MKGVVSNKVYRRGDFIGEGSTAAVYHCTFEDQLLAVKVANETSKDSLIMEFYILRLLKDSPYLVKCVDLVKTKESYAIVKMGDLWTRVKTEESYGLVMQNSGEDLQVFLQKNALSSEDKKDICYQIASACSHVQSLNIYHGDYKCNNFLIEYTGVNYQIKLIDFSHAWYSPVPIVSMCTCIFTGPHCPPEILEGHQYTKVGDVWALGIVFANIITSDGTSQGIYRTDFLKFDDSRHDQLTRHHEEFGTLTEDIGVTDECVGRKAGRYELEAIISPENYDLIGKMLVVNPRHRLTISGVLRHPWFEGRNTYRSIEVPEILRHKYEAIVTSEGADGAVLIIEDSNKYPSHVVGMVGNYLTRKSSRYDGLIAIRFTLALMSATAAEACCEEDCKNEVDKILISTSPRVIDDLAKLSCTYALH